MPFPLPLPSLRSDISPKMSALRRPGWATVTRDKFGPRACRKVCPSERRASGRAARGRRLSPAGSEVDSITCGVCSVWGCLGATLVSQGPPLPALEWPRSGGLSRSLTARRGEGAHSPVWARTSRQLRLLRCAPLLLPARPGVPTSFGEVLAGSFSIARRLDAGASFAPSPRLAPSLFPTTPPPRGADTPPGGA